MTAILKNFIGGEWVDGSGVTRNINPSNTDDVVGEYAQADAAQTDKAHRRGEGRLPGLVALDAAGALRRPERSVATEILARKDELGRLLSREEGKTLPEGIGEVARAGQIFTFFAGEALRLAGEKVASVRPGVDVEITREPVGVVGLITPWNFPIAIPAWKIAPALAYGNCVVFKPADLVPGSASCAGRDHRARGPAGRRVQPGDGPRLGRRRRRCSTHPDVDAITFTGSVATGPQGRAGLRRLEPMKKVQLEMGGKNPLVVLDDADLEVAVEVRGERRLLSRPASAARRRRA